MAVVDTINQAFMGAIKKGPCFIEGAYCILISAMLTQEEGSDTHYYCNHKKGFHQNAADYYKQSPNKTRILWV